MKFAFFGTAAVAVLLSGSAFAGDGYYHDSGRNYNDGRYSNDGYSNGYGNRGDGYRQSDNYYYQGGTANGEYHQYQMMPRYSAWEERCSNYNDNRRRSDINDARYKNDRNRGRDDVRTDGRSNNDNDNRGNSNKNSNARKNGNYSAAEQTTTQFRNSQVALNDSATNGNVHVNVKTNGNANRSNANVARNANDSAVSATDRDTMNKIRAALMQDPTLRASTSSIRIAVNNGSVVLSGTVASNDEKSRIEDLVEDVDGVSDVDNQLIVQANGLKANGNARNGNANTNANGRKVNVNVRTNSNR
ncbi:MAG: BON domain-containing protein [Chlamydiales bacterium]|nr:BON domain-containing protein [Chlamydiales bacterium]